MKKKVGKKLQTGTNNWFNFWFIFVFVLLFIGMALEVDPQPISDKTKKDDGRPLNEASWNNPDNLNAIKKRYGIRN